MDIFVKGVPNYNELAKYEKQMLLSPLVDVIKDFYRNPENRARYEMWLQERKNPAVALVEQTEGQAV